MAELDRILGEAQDTHRQMQEAARTAGDRAVRDIVRLRTRFATLVAEMMGAIKGDVRLRGKPDLARVFELFYRADKARSRELGGTGLGLSIIKHLALAFGGGVQLTSQLGVGSTFQVWLPRA